MSTKQGSNIYKCYNWTICMINDECLFILSLFLREFVEKISDSITYLFKFIMEADVVCYTS